MREEPDLSLTQNSDRATRVLAQPQPNVADLLGRELAADNLWVIMRPGVFAGHFPGKSCFAAGLKLLESSNENFRQWQA